MVSPRLPKARKSAVLQNSDGYSELMEKFKPQNSRALADELWKRVEQELKDARVEIIKATEIPAGPIFESYFDVKSTSSPDKPSIT